MPNDPRAMMPGGRHSGSEAASWIVTQCEPLIATSVRNELDKAMVDLALENASWVATWVAGVVSDMTRTLPVSDPWRNLSASIPVPGKRRMRRGDLVTDLTGQGAINPRTGKRFGTWLDAVDLVGAPASADLTTDLGLAALLRPLSDDASALVAFAADGFTEARESLEAVYARSREGGRDGGRAVWSCGADAIRWAIHRRRSYTGLDDPYPAVSGFAWLVRANEFASGQGPSMVEVELQIASQRIDDDEFEALVKTPEGDGDEF
ncbi:hypothetical protein ACFWGN_11995 [Oerskovia sp. NPDC060338]|uniref:hypothetical protein n=1 Tax=Oerskovia sp. NPDC060338 TaxID=3347100 RepID=UPI003653BFA3